MYIIYNQKLITTIILLKSMYNYNLTFFMFNYLSIVQIHF